MKRVHQTIIVSIALLFSVQAAQAIADMLPEPHNTRYKFIELGGFDPDPTVTPGVVDHPHTPPAGNPAYLPIGINQKSKTGNANTADDVWEVWFGFNLASAASLTLDTLGSVTINNFNQPNENDPLDTILALYLADVNDGAILGQNDNCTDDTSNDDTITSCLSFANLAAGEYIAGVSIIENVEFVHGWPFFMTLGGPNELRVEGDIDLTISVAAPSAVPVPAAVWLFGSALIGFVGLSRRTSVKT